MSDAFIRRELKTLSDNFNEILSSTAAVKGELFANTVAVNFECAQLIEAVGGLVILARKTDAQRADELYEMVKHVLSSIATKACGDLEDAQLEEAIRLSKTLYDRRRQAVVKIQQGMRDDE